MRCLNRVGRPQQHHHQRRWRHPRPGSCRRAFAPPAAQAVHGPQESVAGDAVASQQRRGVLAGILSSLSLAPADAAAAGATGSVTAQAPSQGGAPSAVCQPQLTGAAAARDPLVNRGCATPAALRQELQLAGLLPPRQVDLQVEVQRARAALQACSTALEKHRLLITLKETSAATFYALLDSDLEALLPLVYTPTIADACLAWGSMLQRPAGLYVSLARDAGRVAELLRCWPSDDVRVAVVTDGQRILGLGDLGAHGAGIPAGKCIVHAAAGVPPSWLLPVTVDCGTDNVALRESALYVGTPTPRVQGGVAYDDLMAELVQCLQERFARPVLLHWEDLGAANAFRVLQMADAARTPTFSDDVQATAAAALAAALGAVQVPGVPPLTDQRWLFFGAGQANLGTAQLLVNALQQQGLSAAAARSRIWMVDSKGLLLRSRSRSSLSPKKAAFAQDASNLAAPLISSSSSSSGRPPPLADVIHAVQPTALIGAAAVPGAFDELAIRALSQSVATGARPIVMALSNPRAEVDFEDALRWSDGRVVFASGSPMPAVLWSAQRVLQPAQANNALVFPGLALGMLQAGTRGAASDEQLLAAAGAVAGMLTPEELAQETVLPRVGRLRSVTSVVAAAVAAADARAAGTASTAAWV